jgi:hypothetical protein
MDVIIADSLEFIKQKILFFKRKYRSQVSCYDDPSQRLYGFLIFHDNDNRSGIYDSNVIVDGCYGIRLETLRKLKISAQNVQDFRDWTKSEYSEKFIFSRKKIITLQKLTEIPELYQEVYYSHKGDFISLLRKI